ncbi:MAG: hypothetical protein RLZ98_1617 [Pseudomonadota bacterium]|jgi:hypothetical protein
MTAHSDRQGLRNAAAGKFWRLIEDNPVESSGFAAFVLWLPILVHQSALLGSGPLTPILGSKVTIVALTTSLVTAMSAAACLHFLIAMNNPVRFAETLNDRTNRLRVALTSWVIIAYLVVAAAHFGWQMSQSMLLAPILPLLTLVVANRLWFGLLQRSRQVHESAEIA